MKAIATNRRQAQSISQIKAVIGSKEKSEAYSVAITVVVLAALVASMALTVHVVGFPMHFAPLVIH